MTRTPKRGPLKLGPPGPPLTPEISELDAGKFTIGSLMTGLLTNEIRTPVWIRFDRARHMGFDRARHMVTSANKDAFCQGLLVAMEFLERDRK